MIEWDEENKNALLGLLNEKFMFLKNGDIIRRDDMSNELKARVLNVDTVKEMFDLWYEVMFLKFIVSEAIGSNPKMVEAMNNPEVFDRCRVKAQTFLKDKFKIDLFQNPS